MRYESEFEKEEAVFLREWIVVLVEQDYTSHKENGKTFEYFLDSGQKYCDLRREFIFMGVTIALITPAYPLLPHVAPFRIANHQAEIQLTCMRNYLIDYVLKSLSVNPNWEQLVSSKMKSDIENLNTYVDWDVDENGIRTMSSEWKSEVSLGQSYLVNMQFDFNQLIVSLAIKRINKIQKMLSTVSFFGQNPEQEDFFHISDIKSMFSNYLEFRNKNKFYHVASDVTIPFLKTSPPIDDFEVLPPIWGDAALFKFDFPEHFLPCNFVNENKDSFFGEDRIVSARLDSIIVRYVEKTNSAIYPKGIPSEKLKNELKKLSGYVESCTLTGEQAQPLFDAILISHGAVQWEGPSYQVTFNIDFKLSKGEDAIQCEHLIITDRFDVSDQVICEDWGKEINTSLITLVMNLFYALNRTHIIEKQTFYKRQSKKHRKRRSKHKPQIAYTNLKLDTKFKKTVVFSSKEKSKDLFPMAGTRPYERDAHWRRVWVLPKNLKSWDRTPDGEKRHPKTGNLLYRVARLCSGTSNGSVSSQKLTKVKKWNKKTA